MGGGVWPVRIGGMLCDTIEKELVLFCTLNGVQQRKILGHMGSIENIY